MSNEKLSFDEALDDEDFGFIVCGKTGKLKGLWIPDGRPDDEVPQSIIDLCVHVFDIDPKEFIEDDDMGEPPTSTVH